MLFAFLFMMPSLCAGWAGPSASQRFKAWTDAGDALVAELEAEAREYARRAAQAATTGVMGFDLETSEAHGFATARRSDAQEAVATWTAAFDADVESYNEQKRALASQVDGGAVLAVALTDEEVEFETKKRLLAAEIRARASKSMFAFAAHKNTMITRSPGASQPCIDAAETLPLSGPGAGARQVCWWQHLRRCSAAQ